MTGFLVYTHTRLDTGAIFYVGKGTARRVRRATNRNPHWHRIVAKAGGFGSQIVKADITESAALQLECETIARLRAEGVALCNMTDGGDGISGYRHTAAARQAMSDRMKGSIPPNKGQKTSPEVIAKFRAAKVGWKPTPAMIAAVKASLTGVPKSETHRRNMAAAQRGKRQSSAVRAKTGRAVICVTTGENFGSIGLAAEATSTQRANIVRVCQGVFKQTGGLRFQYASEALST